MFGADVQLSNEFVDALMSVTMRTQQEINDRVSFLQGIVDNRRGDDWAEKEEEKARNTDLHSIYVVGEQFPFKIQQNLVCTSNYV